MDKNDLIVQSYLLVEQPRHHGSNVTLERRTQEDGSVLWAIYQGERTVAHKKGYWVLEGFPSERTKRHLKMCRFASVDEALAFWNKWSGTCTTCGKVWIRLEQGLCDVCLYRSNRMKELPQ